MDSRTAHELGRSIRTAGIGLATDPQRIRALLTEACPEARTEIGLIVVAAEDGIPARLMRSSNPLLSDGDLASAIADLRWTRRLDHYAADWVVRTWAWALGLVGPHPWEQPVGRSAVREDRIDTFPLNPPGRPPEPAPPSRPERRRLVAVIAAVVVVAVLAVVGVAFVLGGGSTPAIRPPVAGAPTTPVAPPAPTTPSSPPEVAFTIQSFLDPQIEVADTVTVYSYGREVGTLQVNGSSQAAQLAVTSAPGEIDYQLQITIFLADDLGGGQVTLNGSGSVTAFEGAVYVVRIAENSAGELMATLQAGPSTT